MGLQGVISTNTGPMMVQESLLREFCGGATNSSCRSTTSARLRASPTMMRQSCTSPVIQKRMLRGFSL